MKKLFLTFLLAVSTQASNTEFYCDPVNGDDLASGSTAGAVTFTAVGDSDGTSIFTPSDGSTPASTISAGMFASVYLTLGATVATFDGRITAVSAGVNGSIIFASNGVSGALGTNFCGAFPVSSAGAHTITIKVGGAWKGMHGSSIFPMNFVQGGLVDATGNWTRVNFLNTANYGITAAISYTNTIGNVIFQGYSVTPGDQAKAVIDGGTSGASYVLLTIGSTCTQLSFRDLEFSHNGATGSADGVLCNASECQFLRVKFDNVRRQGLRLAGNAAAVLCEFTACNQSNTSNFGALGLNASGALGLACYSHDNPGSNADGIAIDGGVCLIFSTSCRNGRHGASSTGDVNQTIICNNFYDNAGSNVNLGAGSTDNMLINYWCNNFLKAGLFGINFNAQRHNGTFYNNGFGAGTMANASGNFSSSVHGLDVVGSVSYGSGLTPWNNPASGSFNTVLSTARRIPISYNQSDGGVTTIYLDIGAAQSRPPTVSYSN